MLERKLARGVLLTTAGFEDVLEITRHVRREIYAVDPDPFPCLIPRDRRLGVAERMRADGSVETALDEAAMPRCWRGWMRSAPRPSPSACCTPTSTRRMSSG